MQEKREDINCFAHKEHVFCLYKGKRFGWILLLLWVFFFLKKIIIYQVIHCIERKYGKRIAIET